MSRQSRPKPITLAVGAALAGSLLSLPAASADASPFSLTALSSGYMLADAGEGKCGEGKCGGDKAEEGKCGEGKCGGDKAEEGKCGEGKCGGDKGSETATAAEQSSEAGQTGGGAVSWLLLGGLPLVRRKRK